MLENYIIFIAPFFIIPTLYLLFVNMTLEKQWNPTIEQYGDIQYFRNIERTKHFEIEEINIGIKSIDGYSFILKNETDSDLNAKRNGISTEFQTGNDEFDNRIYIISDIKSINNTFKDAKLQDLILSIFYDTTYGCTLTKIILENGRLWISLSAGKNVAPNNIDYISHTLLDRLSIINNILMKRLMKVPIPNDKSKLTYNKYTALSMSIFIYGILLYAAHSFYEIYHLDIDAEHILLLSTSISIAVIGMLLFLAIKTINKSSRTHTLLYNILIFAGLGIFSTSYFTISYANVFFDSSAQTEYTTTVIDKHSEHGKRRDSYWITIKTNDNITFNLPIGAGEYDNFNPSDKIKVIEHLGYFHAHWISDYKKI